MNFLERLWNKLPWFHLKTKDNEVLRGKMLPDRSIELVVETQWGNVLLYVDSKEAQQLRDWLKRAYPDSSQTKGNPSGSVAALPIRRTPGDSGPGSGGSR